MSKILKEKEQNRRTQKVSYMNSLYRRQVSYRRPFTTTSDATSYPLGSSIGFNVFV